MLLFTDMTAWGYPDILLDDSVTPFPASERPATSASAGSSGTISPTKTWNISWWCTSDCVSCSVVFQTAAGRMWWVLLSGFRLGCVGLSPSGRGRAAGPSGTWTMSGIVTGRCVSGHLHLTGSMKSVHQSPPSLPPCTVNHIVQLFHQLWVLTGLDLPIQLHHHGDHVWGERGDAWEGGAEVCVLAPRAWLLGKDVQQTVID